MHTCCCGAYTSCKHCPYALRFVGYAGLPLNNATWVGTRNSFNTLVSNLTRSGFETKPSQKLSVLEQLELGSRILEIEVHLDQATGQLVLCHTLDGIQAALQSNCSTTGWPACEARGVADRGARCVQAHAPHAPACRIDDVIAVQQQHWMPRGCAAGVVCALRSARVARPAGKRTAAHHH
jgi:hypothetical protein